jgi:hypothetical protein
MKTERYLAFAERLIRHDRAGFEKLLAWRLRVADLHSILPLTQSAAIQDAFDRCLPGWNEYADNRADFREFLSGDGSCHECLDYLSIAGYQKLIEIKEPANFL